MLKLRELALQPDFQLGPLEISPSRRLVSGPAGKAHVEPLIMQAMLLLLDARGSVVTRDELFEQCWGSAAVGDDSLNRAVANLRRVFEEVAPGQAEIETIPRTGYRLTGEILEHPEKGPEETPEEATARRLSRRTIVGGGAAAIAALGGGLWLATRDRTNPRFEALMARGDEALRNGDYDDPKIASLYQEAVRLDPNSAKAWGLLAFFKSVGLEDAPPEQIGRTIQQAEEAAKTALQLDPKESNALTTMHILRGRMFNWAAQDRQIRDILGIDGKSIPAMRELMTLLQAAGFTRESQSWNERILSLAPLSRPNLVIRAMKLWLLGNITGADKVIDHVRGLWPDYPFAFFARLMIYALTDRPRAALAMLDSSPNKIRRPTAALSLVSLKALDTRSATDVEAARIACLDAARMEPRTANMAVMILCKLGLTDAAFEITNGFLLGRGKQVSSNQADTTVNNSNRRLTPWLFSPPVAVMRADPRFLKLCDEFGLTAYWRARGVKPDYMLS